VTILQLKRVAPRRYRWNRPFFERFFVLGFRWVAVRQLPMRASFREARRMDHAAKGRLDKGSVGVILPTAVGRKPRRFWSVRPLVTLPHAPGLGNTLPADNYCIGVRLDLS
jgi:hypothetical protein